MKMNKKYNSIIDDVDKKLGIKKDLKNKKFEERWIEAYV